MTATSLLVMALLLIAVAPARPEHNPTSRHAETVEYRNLTYGFSLSLPPSWKGYRVLWSEWRSEPLTTDENSSLHGPVLRIRHPRWTENTPREDLPIMIFTIAQWNKHPIVSAAPFDPPKLGSNGKYVFAVPPRWNYDAAEGWEEATKILSPKSFHTFKQGR